MKSNDTTVFYSGGIRFMINDTLLLKVTMFKTMSERVCYIRIFIPNYGIIIINCLIIINI